MFTIMKSWGVLFGIFLTVYLAAVSLRADVPSIRVHRVSQREIGGGLYRIVVCQYTGKGFHLKLRYIKQLLFLLAVVLEISVLKLFRSPSRYTLQCETLILMVER